MYRVNLQRSVQVHRIGLQCDLQMHGIRLWRHWRLLRLDVQSSRKLLQRGL
jgi:hypothetical protein